MSSDDARNDTGGGRPAPNRKVIAIAAVAVVVLAIAGYAVYALTGSGTAAGECVRITGADGDKLAVTPDDCGADLANFRVGKVVDGADAPCPEEGVYTEARGSGSSTLCLLPNMVEGACYGPDDRGFGGLVRSGCTGEATIKVTKVIEGSTDTSGCPDGAGMSYPEPPITFCVVPADL